jgi:hypothetical protein
MDAFATIVAWTPVLALAVGAVWLVLVGLAHFEAVTYGTEYLVPQTPVNPMDQGVANMRANEELARQYGAY